MQLIRLEGSVPWRCFRNRKTGQWIAICDPLKITAEGETWQELNQTIAEMLNAMLSDLLRTGDLKKFLTAHGWKPDKPIPAKPKNVHFDIPWEIVKQAAYDSKAAVH